MLYLIDGYALIYRAFFALLSRPLTTARGENTSAAWGVVNFLIRLLSNRHPTYVAWVHDSGRSFRHEVLPAYKATRQKLSDELQADFDLGVKRIQELLDAYHIQVLTVPGYEADDVIGSLAKQAKTRGVNVVIVSGDKDFQQCVEPGVWLLNPGRGGPAAVDEQWVSVENALDRLGVPPERVTDYLALVGDSSDNVPGVPGVGEKTARELIAEFGDLTTILASVDKITKKRPREALAAFAEQARLSKELVTIRYDVPIDLELSALATTPPDANRLRQLFLELEFTSLLKSVDGAVRERPTTVATYELVDDLSALDLLVTRMAGTSTLGISVVTVADSIDARADDPLRSILVGLAVATDSGAAYYLPFRHRSPSPSQGDLLERSAVPASRTGPARVTGAAESAGRDLADVRNLPPVTSPELSGFLDILRRKDTTCVTSDAKFHTLAFTRAGVGSVHFGFDSMLASYVLDPGRRAHTLELLALEFLEHSMMSVDALLGKGRDAISLDLVHPSDVCRYACERADIARQLHGVLKKALEDQGLLELLHSLEMPLVEVLADMEAVGIAIDLPWFRSLKDRFQTERLRVEGQIYEAAGERFNINSNQQLRSILFDKLQLPVKKRTPTGPSTDATVLQELADEGHVLPVLLMEYRELAKLESTYIDALPRLVHPGDKRLHTSFNQTVAATGRLSSSDPNLQNIPIRRELGRDIRRGFIAREGWMLVAADYSQIELRLLAHLSGDPAFVEAFHRGGDIHRETAAIIFGTQVADVTADMRARAKTINFATIYGQGPVALARQLKIPIQEAREFINTYFERFRGVREYLDSQIAFAKEHGYVQTVFQRRRYIPELRDRNFNIRAFGERVATNAPIQGSAADLIKAAMIRIHAFLKGSQLEGRMLLQVHDELVFEVAPDVLETLQERVRHEMEHATELSVPLVVDIGVGANWLETKSR